jgi:hypothetical protein
MVLYNLYLVLNNEIVKVYDNAIHSIVYEGSSENIPHELMSELVHDINVVYGRHMNAPYILINLN